MTQRRPAGAVELPYNFVLDCRGGQHPWGLNDDGLVDELSDDEHRSALGRRRRHRSLGQLSAADSGTLPDAQQSMQPMTPQQQAVEQHKIYRKRQAEALSAIKQELVSTAAGCSLPSLCSRAGAVLNRLWWSLLILHARCLSLCTCSTYVVLTLADQGWQLHLDAVLYQHCF